MSLQDLRRRLADSDWINRRIEGLVAAYLRFAFRSSRWQVSGFEPMAEALRAGQPVILAAWHQRLMMVPWYFDASLGKFCTLTSEARAGRMVGRILGRFGFDTIGMSLNRRHVMLSRVVLKKMQEGFSIGIATDGPSGPARVASTVPLVWARASGAPVFVVAFSARRVIELPTWDRMWLPAPFTRGVLMCRQWEAAVPRKATEDEIEALRVELEAALDAVTEAADEAAGRGG